MKHLIPLPWSPHRPILLWNRFITVRNECLPSLSEQLAGEWISDGLTEQRITEIATYQLPGEHMQAHTIKKDFREALDPQEQHEYSDLPALALY